MEWAQESGRQKGTCLYVSAIRETIDMGVRSSYVTRVRIPLEELAPSSVWTVFECDGQTNPNNADETVHLQFSLRVEGLTEDTLNFIFADKTGSKAYTLERRWQVLGTPGFGIPNPMISESVCFIFWFGTDGEGTPEDAACLTPDLPYQSLHILKDKGDFVSDEKAEAFCKELIAKLQQEEDVDTDLLLSYLDYFHVLAGSTYYENNLTYSLLQKSRR